MLFPTNHVHSDARCIFQLPSPLNRCVLSKRRRIVRTVGDLKQLARPSWRRRPAGFLPFPSPQLLLLQNQKVTASGQGLCFLPLNAIVLMTACECCILQVFRYLIQPRGDTRKSTAGTYHHQLSCSHHSGPQ